MADTLETLEIEVKHKASGAADEIDKVTDSIKKLAQALGAIPKVNNSVSGASKGIKEMAKSAQKAKKPLDNFIASLKRIAFYRVIRSIIKSITSAFSEGLQNAYAFSQGIESEGHRFAAAMDSMKTAGSTMKNQLGSAFIALLTALAPIINAIIGLVTRLANALAQLFSAFTGSTYLKAADVPQKWADAAGGAAKAAKEWKNQLLGFDEINRLEEPSDGGGGGGGGGIDPSQMFEDTPLDAWAKRLREKLLEFKDSLNFEPLIASWERVKTAFGNLADTIGRAIGWLWDNIVAPFIKWVIEELLPVCLNIVADLVEIANTILNALAPAWQWLWDNILKPIATWIGDVLISSLKDLNGFLEKLSKLLKGEISFKEFLQGLSDSEAAVGALTIAVGAVGLFGALSSLKDLLAVGLFLAIGKVNVALSTFAANPVVLAIAAIGALIFIVYELWKHWDQIITKLREVQATMHEALTNGKFDWIDFAAVAVQVIMAPIDAIITLVNWIITAINWLRALDNTRISASVSNAIANDTYTGGNYYADGGYPDSGQLFWAREDGAGAELVGTVGGRTAVASNNDILDGIRQGVFEAVTAAMSNGDRDVDVRVYLDSREIKVGQNRLNRALGVG